MDFIGFIFEVLRVIFGFLLVLFLPGFCLSLLYYPRATDLSFLERLVYSAVLSIGSVMVLVLFMEFILGVNTTPRNIALFICVLSFLCLLVWWGEWGYLKSRKKTNVDLLLSKDNHTPRNFFIRGRDSVRDRFLRTTRSEIVYHTVQEDGENHRDHSYLIDVGDEIDIQQIRENTGRKGRKGRKGRIQDIEILHAPHPKTRYFELVVRENSLSLIDDLEIYPVLVTKKPDIRILGFVIKKGTATVIERLYRKESTSEIQWIYSQDIHLFTLIHPEDSLDEMVDRIIAKLHEIVISIQRGSPISSHLEVTRMLREASDEAVEQTGSATPGSIIKGESARIPEGDLKEIERPPEVLRNAGPKAGFGRTLKKEILRFLNLFGITPDSSGNSRKAIEQGKILKKSDVNKKSAENEEGFLDFAWLLK
jgi:hypothetical protein